MWSDQFDSLQIGFQVRNKVTQKWILPFELIAANNGPDDVVNGCC